MVFPSVSQHTPRPPQLNIERARLLEKLRPPINRKLTLIVAPPGYGKTTLAAQFAQQASLPVVWHTVEERERDVPNLQNHCLEALSKFVTDTDTLAPRSGLAANELAGLVADCLRRSLTSPLIYVLDDAHHLIGSTRAETWLRTLVTLLPSTCHLILISRVLPKLPLTEMVERQEVLALSQEELSFTLAETRELARRSDTDISDLTLEKVAARLNGWPAGIILALHPLPSDLEQLLFGGSTGPEALFGALAEQMLNAQPPTLRDFLLASSTLSKMTPDLCQTILKLPNSLEHLSEALNRSLFTSDVAGGLVYHPLFRDFLQRQLKANQPLQFLELHSKAAQWFEHNNLLDDAFEHYWIAERTEQAVQIAERAAQAYFVQGKIETLLRWSQRLIGQSVQAPNLFHTCAMVHTDRYDYDLAVNEIKRATCGYQVREDEIGLMKIKLLEATIDNQRGNHDEAIHLVEELVYSASTPDNLRGHALMVLGVAHLNLGTLTTAIGFLETALPLFQIVGDAHGLSQLLQFMEVAYFQAGLFDKASACLQEVVAIRRTLGSVIGLALALNNLGYHYHMLGDYEQAYITFQEGLSIATSAPEKRAESYLRWSLGDLQRDRGSFDEAFLFYSKALELIENDEPALRCGVLTSLATLRRWQGNFDDAYATAVESLDLATIHNVISEKLKAEVAILTIRAILGETETSLDALEALAIEYRQRNMLSRVAQVRGACAYVALLNSNTIGARKYLKLISQEQEHHANLQPLIAEIMHNPMLKNFVARHRVRYPLLTEGLLCLESAQVDFSAAETQNTNRDSTPTYSLRIWCLGQERIERDGKVITSYDWQSTTARELFYYLLFKGPSTRELISLDFWPDSSSTQVRGSFHTSLYRVRHAVGNNVILLEDKRYFINPDVQLWCDANELEHLVQQARPLAPRTAHAENLWRRAVELYQGKFLPSFDTPWADGKRALLEETFVEALLGLGHATSARGDLQKAILTFKRALEVDPYREDIHRTIFLCYAASGDRYLVSQYFEYLRKLFLDELGIELSNETVALVRKLLD